MTAVTTAAAIPLSGEQHTIERGELRAVIASVGASLRSYTAAGRDLIVPFGADEVRPNYRGVTVAPWPNRIVDGRYTFDGVEHQVALTEPGRGQALHGFTPWLNFVQVTEAADAEGAEAAAVNAGSGSGIPASPSTASSVLLRATVEPQDGYPWRLRIETRYTLDDRGLTQLVTATNLSETVAPYGVCPHPYLVAGPGALDTWQLKLPAAQVLTVSEPRLSPVSLEEVTHDAARFDFREARAIGAVQLDHAFTGLGRDASGEARVELRDPSGSGVAMSWGPECGWLQVHTADVPGSPADRLGLAVEPMSCAPDAFNGGTGRGLVRLAAGETHSASWRIDPL